MFQWYVAGLIVMGSLLSLLAAVGIVRMPDIYTRMHAAAKSSTLGISLLVVAAALLMESPGASVRAVLIILFLLLTAPVSAHMIGRAAYTMKTNLWEGTVVDELSEHREYFEGHEILRPPEARSEE